MPQEASFAAPTKNASLHGDALSTPMFRRIVSVLVAVAAGAAGASPWADERRELQVCVCGGPPMCTDGGCYEPLQGQDCDNGSPPEQDLCADCSSCNTGAPTASRPPSGAPTEYFCYCSTSKPVCIEGGVDACYEPQSGLPCDNGSPPNNQLCDDCVTDVTGAGCAACPAGKISAEAGASACAMCPVNTYASTVGSTECVDCAAGRQSALGSQTCGFCAAGQYETVDGDGDAACVDCDAGAYQRGAGSATADTVDCVVCAAGTYSAGDANSECAPCAAGRASSAGASACDACDAGRFANATGAATCDLAAPGFYVARPAAARPVPAGTFSAGAAATACEACPQARTPPAPARRPARSRARTRTSRRRARRAAACARASARGAAAAGAPTATPSATFADHKPDDAAPDDGGADAAAEPAPSPSPRRRPPAPAPRPSLAPTVATAAPSPKPTPAPSPRPSAAPTTAAPSARPSVAPTGAFLRISSVGVGSTCVLNEACVLSWTFQGDGCETLDVSVVDGDGDLVTSETTDNDGQEIKELPGDGDLDGQTFTLTLACSDSGARRRLRLSVSFYPAPSPAPTPAPTRAVVKPTATPPAPSPATVAGAGASADASAVGGALRRAVAATVAAPSPAPTPEPSPKPTPSPSTAAPSANCAPGFVVADDDASECPAGTYGLAGESYCVDCPAGSYAAAAGVTTCTVASAGSSVPAAGSTAQTASCAVAGAGTYVDAAGASEATACAASAFSGAGATACEACPDGAYYVAGDSGCAFSGGGAAGAGGVACPAGTYSGAGASCEACAAGTYSASSGATACAAAAAGASAASSGDRGPASRRNILARAPARRRGCAPCDAGTFAAAEGLSTCALAAEGSYVDAAGASEQVPCAAGTYAAGNGASSCAACPAGSYSDSSGASSCALADAGYTAGAAASEQALCPAGSYSGSGASACVACEAGRYAPGEAQSRCALASGGTFVAWSGATAAAACSSGRYSGSGATFCSLCADGTTSDEGAATCRPTEAGYIAPTAEIYELAIRSSLVFASGDADACAASAAAFLEDRFATDVLLDDAAVAYGGATASDDGATIVSLVLTANYSATSTENVSKVAALVASDFEDGASLAIYDGSLEDAVASTGCALDSDASLETVAETTGDEALVSAATFDGERECPAGTFSLAGTACLYCDLGTFTPSPGATTCDFADAGFYVNRYGATSQEPCAPGRVGATSCALASAGFYVGTAAGEAPCDAGYFSAAGATECFACPPATFSSSPGSTECTLAEAGYYVGAAGSSPRRPAPGRVLGRRRVGVRRLRRGSYAAAAATAACSLATAGYYVASSRSAVTLSNVSAAEFNNDTASQADYVAVLEETLVADGGFSDMVDSSAITSVGPATDVEARRRLEDGTTVTTLLASIAFAMDANYTAAAGENVSDAAAVIAEDLAEDLTESIESGKLEEAIARHANGSFGARASVDRDYSLADAAGSGSVGFLRKKKRGSSSQTADCGPGTYSLLGATVCVSCAPGSFTGASKRTACELAPAGSFLANATGATACAFADAGFYVAATGSADQVACDAGTYSNPGAYACIPCERGAFSGSGTAECAACAYPLTTSASGASSCDACGAGYYWDTVAAAAGTTGAALCVLCPEEGSRCLSEGITLETLPLKADYWRASLHSDELYACALDDACGGGAADYCEDGHGGPLCGVCDAGWTLDLVANSRLTVEASSAYALFCLSFLCLPSCAAITLQFFGCARYDLGADGGDLSVLYADQSVDCSGARRASWRPYALLMVALYPVGVPLCYALLPLAPPRDLNPSAAAVAAKRSTQRGGPSSSSLDGDAAEAEVSDARDDVAPSARCAKALFKPAQFADDSDDEEGKEPPRCDGAPAAAPPPATPGADGAGRREPGRGVVLGPVEDRGPTTDGAFRRRRRRAASPLWTNQEHREEPPSPVRIDPRARDVADLDRLDDVDLPAQL
ncbi:hypothetical protein JL721_6835 [Aureococcus anophagefferens]|nr:hypothetical protein JL721_6835 [Aureococcus anophagefferens]